MRVSQFALMVLTTFLGHQTNTALTQSFDAYGVTHRGFSCNGHEFMNPDIYAQANFACMGGKLNHTITNDANVKREFMFFLPYIVDNVRDSISTGFLYVAPLFRKDVKYMQDTFISQNKNVGPDRLVLNEYCDVITAITYRRIRDETGQYTYPEIQNCIEFQ
ncbi:hypothetical protein GcM3_101032 [Golovinomyces cichoracearum]|uniref:Secreted effector protein n=1 Tax=Golovinomyces cichoracearum TaxID=62708 RepID=A0A420IAD4_9PEZI|nr:hypothetical protein GcM3_101032 [Golovinomyces cichoracearum]